MMLLSRPIQVSRRALVLAPPLLAALSLLGVGCHEGSSEVTVETENSVAASGGPASTGVLARLPQQEQALIMHHGVRVFESHAWVGDVPNITKFRESVDVDGLGNYTIQALDGIEGIQPSWALFQLIQSMRQGQVAKHRDFAVRDQALFLQNWKLADPGYQDVVAGRTCQLYAIDRQAAGAPKYTIAVDMDTGLVLRYVEVDSRGRTLSRLEYESVDYAPDFTGVPWHDEAPRVQIDLEQSFLDQVGFDPLVPQLLPRGYQLQGAEVVEEGGVKWLSMEHCDGVNSLFFLQQFPKFLARTVGSTGPGGATPMDGSDRMMVFRIGSAAGLQGNISERGVIAVGKVSEVELLDMIESALH